MHTKIPPSPARQADSPRGLDTCGSPAGRAGRSKAAMDIQPHAFAPTPGSARCAVPGCGSPRLAMIHATPGGAVRRSARIDEAQPAIPIDVSDPALSSRAAHEVVPPLPAEPAFGSPEAVEQAAETLRDDADMQDALDAMDEEADAEIPSALRAEVERLRVELDALADALERTTISYSGNPAAGTHYAECSQGKRGQAPDDDRCSNVCKAVRAALKLSGRLKS